MSRSWTRSRAVLLAVAPAAGGASPVVSAAPTPNGVSVHTDTSLEMVRAAARTFSVSDGGFVLTYQMGRPLGCEPGSGFDDLTGLGSARAGMDAALAGVAKK